MIYLVALAAAYLPVIGWAWFFYGQDRYHPLPRRLVVTLFLLGLGATAPTGWINEYLLTIADSWAGLLRTGSAPPEQVFAVFVLVYAAAAFLEESVKLGFGWARLAGEPAMVEVVDGVIALTTVGLGFAAAENTRYVFDQLAAGSAATDAASLLAAIVAVAPGRGIVSTLGHAAWSGIVGYAVGLVVVGVGSRRLLMGAVVGAAALHAAFNTLASPDLASLGLVDPTVGRVGALLVWGIALATFALLLKRALDQSPYRTLQLRSRLLRLPALADVPAERLAGAAQRLVPEVVRSGTLVARQGAPAERFIVVIEGRFTVTQTPGPGATPRRLPDLVAGDVFGQVALLTDRPTTADVTAETDGMVLTLDRAAFEALVADDEPLRQQLLELARGGSTGQAVGATLRHYSRTVRSMPSTAHPASAEPLVEP